MRILPFAKPALTLALLTTTGCVTLGTHDEVVRAHQETRTRLAEQQLGNAQILRKLDDEQKRSRSLEEALQAERARVAALEGERASLEAKLKDAEARLASSQSELVERRADLAQVLKDKSTLKQNVDEMKQALDELARRRAEAERRVVEYKGLLQRFESLISGGKLKVKIVDGRMVVELMSDVLFGSGSASLSKEGRAAAQEVSVLLAQIPDKRFQIEGHTDSIPIKTDAFPSNWELASARALGVLKAMVDAGMPAARVSAASFGAEKPASSNDTAEGRALNRRIEIVVVPDLSSLPGFDELSKAAR
jgi:chemotaxis protein MotB